MKCGVEQPLENFYKAAGTRDGRRGDCKACFRARAKARYPLVRERAIARARRWREENLDRFRATQRRMRATPGGRRKQREDHLKRKYGISIEEYDALLSRQEGDCAICGQPPRSDISLHVDHDHDTGAIRGLLCFRCNNALGDFGDDADRLIGAAGYLGPVPKEPALVRRLDELRALQALG